MAAEVCVESHQSEMEDTLAGRIDPEYRDWIRNIDMITKSNQASKADFKGELDKRFDTPDNVWWVEFRNGANRKSKSLAYEICHVMAYYDQVFSEANLSKIFGVQPGNHNTKLALEKLSDLRILRKTTDDEGLEVYKFVNMLQMHLKYESNERIERRIGKDLKRLYKEGRAIITARSEKKGRQTTTVTTNAIPITMDRRTTIMMQVLIAMMTAIMRENPIAKWRRMTTIAT